MPTKGELWRGFGEALAVVAVVVLLLLLVAVPLQHYYSAHYAETLVHMMWGALIVLALQLHWILAPCYTALIITYQVEDSGLNNMELASYSAGLIVAGSVVMFWQFYVRPSVDPKKLGNPILKSFQN